VATEAILTLGQAFEVAYQLALVSHTQSRDQKGHMRSKSANQLSTATTTTTTNKSTSPHSRPKRDLHHQKHGLVSNLTANNNQQQQGQAHHYRSQSVNDIPPPPTHGTISKSTSNSPQIHPHVKQDFYKIPRADSFNFSSNSNLARAPIVSKEEL
jgi:hypothetical protein